MTITIPLVLSSHYQASEAASVKREYVADYRRLNSIGRILPAAKSRNARTLGASRRALGWVGVSGTSTALRTTGRSGLCPPLAPPSPASSFAADLRGRRRPRRGRRRLRHRRRPHRLVHLSGTRAGAARPARRSPVRRSAAAAAGSDAVAQSGSAPHCPGGGSGVAPDDASARHPSFPAVFAVREGDRAALLRGSIRDPGRRGEQLLDPVDGRARSPPAARTVLRTPQRPLRGQQRGRVVRGRRRPRRRCECRRRRRRADGARAHRFSRWPLYGASPAAPA